MTSSHPAEDVRIFHKECKSLHQAGYDVFLIAPGESFEKEGIHIVGVGHLGAGRKERFLKTAKDVYRKALQIDASIYHFHDPELLPYGVKLAKRGKCVIFDSHEHVVELMMDRDYIPNVIRIPGRFILDKYVRACVKKLSAVITVTPHIVRYYEQCAKKTVQIANFPIIAESQFEKLAPRNRSIVFAGGISSQWDHHRIINAIADIPECTYNLCGSVSVEYLEKLKNIRGWEKVNYIGKLPFSEVSTFLKKSSIGVALLIPSHNTGGMEGTIGNTKIFEEMMAGLPIICTNFVLWKEMVDKHKCGIYVDPQNVDAIRDAIKWLLDNPKEAFSMGLNGIQAIRSEYNWSQEANKLNSLYAELLAD